MNKTVIKLLVIPIALVVIIYITSILLMIFYSFTDFNGYSNTYNFVGFNNYLNVFNDNVIDAFKTTGFYFLSAIFQLVIGTYLAFYVYFQKRFKKTLFILIIIPLLINSVAVGLSFTMFLKPLGTFDQILNMVGITNYSEATQTIKWLGNMKIVNYALAVITMWKFTPFTFILMYFAINSVNKDMIKSAMLQGASRFQIARYVILPNISHTIKIVIAMLLVGSVTAFEIPKVMTNGNLNTKTVLIQINEMAFNMRNYGLASVLTIVVVIIIIMISIITMRRDTNETV